MITFLKEGAARAQQKRDDKRLHEEMRTVYYRKLFIQIGHAMSDSREKRISRVLLKREFM